MKHLPRDAVAYQRTPTFRHDTIPAGLLKAHRTKAGTWGRIVIESGALNYRILEPAIEDVQLVPGRDGIVEPAVPHEVRPLGEVQFFVEFLRVSAPPSETPDCVPGAWQ